MCGLIFLFSQMVESLALQWFTVLPSAAGLHVPWVCVWALCPFLFPALNCYFEVSVFCRFYGCFSHLLVVLSILLLFCVTCSALRWSLYYILRLSFKMKCLSVFSFQYWSWSPRPMHLRKALYPWASSFTTLRFIYYILNCYFDIFFKLLLNVMFCF